MERSKLVATDFEHFNFLPPPELNTLSETHKEKKFV